MPDIPELERLRNNISNRREDRLRNARAVEGDFLIEEEQAGVAAEERVKDTIAAEQVIDSAAAGLQDTAASTIGREIGIRTEAVSTLLNSGQDVTTQAVAKELLKLSERFDDPNWDPRNNKDQRKIIEDDIRKLGLDIEGPEAESIMSARSEYEKGLVIELIEQDRERMQNVADAGALGLVSYTAASILDIDTLVGVGIFTKLSKAKRIKQLNKLVKDGKLTGDEAKHLGTASSRSGNFLRGAEAGGASALIVEGTRAALDPVADEKDVLGAVVLSTALGSGIGAALPTRAVDQLAADVAENRILADAVRTTKQEEKGVKTADPVPGNPELRTERPADLTQEELALDAAPESNAPRTDTEARTEGNDSVGAASAGRPENVSIAASSREKHQLAWDFLDENPELDAAFHILDEFVEENASPAQKIAQRIAEKVYQGIQKTPFINDYDRLVRDAGVVGKYLAYHTLESPVGQIVNNRSASATVDLIQREAAIQYAPNVGMYYDTWAKDRGIKRVSKEYIFNGHLKFGKELQKYRETIHAGRKPDPDTHPSIVKASEDLDRAYAKALDNNKRFGVEGFEDVEFVPGYTPRKWRGDKFANIESKLGIGTQRVIDALKEGIMRKTPDMDEEEALIFATAIRRSARNSQLKSPVGSLMTVNNEGVTALEEAIQDLGLDVAPGRDAQEMANAILFKNNDRGTVKSSRRRIDIDMTTPIAGTDKSLLDLIDNDIYAITDRAIRGQANHAALASVGIQNRDKEAWIKAAMDEAESVGKDPIAAAKVVNDVFSYYGEGAFAGGQGPISGRINKLATQP